MQQKHLLGYRLLITLLCYVFIGLGCSLLASSANVERSSRACNYNEPPYPIECFEITSYEPIPLLSGAALIAVAIPLWIRYGYRRLTKIVMLALFAIVVYWCALTTGMLRSR